MHKPRLHEEVIGVTIPGQGSMLATVRVSASTTDEEILKGLSKVPGTIFNVTGIRYQLVSYNPFKLRKLNGESSTPEPKIAEKAEPKVGDVWKTRDKRRTTQFKIAAIDDEYAITDDSRRIQLARFCRYDLVRP